MTEENYNYRTSQIMLRNQFPGDGRWNIPIIPKFQEKPGEFPIVKDTFTPTAQNPRLQSLFAEN